MQRVTYQLPPNKFAQIYKIYWKPLGSASWVLFSGTYSIPCFWEWGREEETSKFKTEQKPRTHKKAQTRINRHKGAGVSRIAPWLAHPGPFSQWLVFEWVFPRFRSKWARILLYAQCPGPGHTWVVTSAASDERWTARHRSDLCQDTQRETRKVNRVSYRVPRVIEKPCLKPTPPPKKNKNNPPTHTHFTSAA